MPFTKLRYHIVSGTHQGLPLITSDIEKILYKLMQNEALELGGKFIALGGTENHVHGVAIIPESVALSEFVQKVKANSSRILNRTQQMDQEFALQEGYGAFTVDPRAMIPIIKYVKNQKQHHADNSLIKHLETRE
mgnify:CR=1 FL=1